MGMLWRRLAAVSLAGVCVAGCAVERLATPVPVQEIREAETPPAQATVPVTPATETRPQAAATQVHTETQVEERRSTRILVK